MKKTYVERIESRTALSRKMSCPSCGGHGYEVVEQLEPFTKLRWRIRCEDCGHEGIPSPTREIAFLAWKLGDYRDC